MAAPLKSISGGNNYAFLIWYDDNNNFLTGGTRTAPAAGDQDGNPGVRVLGIQTASPTVGQPEAIQVTGDDGLLGELDFDSVESRQFLLNVGVQDLDLAASLNNVNTFNAAGGTLMTLDTDEVDDRNACLILQSKAENTTTGGSAWTGVFAITGTTKYLGRETFEGRTAGAFRFSFTPKRGQYLPWGVTLSNSVQGSERARYLPYSVEYPFHVQVFTGDGVETEFNLKHDPVALSSIAAWQDRVSLSISSLSGNTITFASAPTNNRPVIVLYQFDRYNS